MSAKRASDFGKLQLDDTFALLRSSISALTDSEAKVRLQRFGRMKSIVLNDVLDRNSQIIRSTANMILRQ